MYSSPSYPNYGTQQQPPLHVTSNNDTQWSRGAKWERGDLPPTYKAKYSSSGGGTHSNPPSMPPLTSLSTNQHSAPAPQHSTLSSYVAETSSGVGGGVYDHAAHLFAKLGETVGGGSEREASLNAQQGGGGSSWFGRGGGGEDGSSAASQSTAPSESGESEGQGLLSKGMSYAASGFGVMKSSARGVVSGGQQRIEDSGISLGTTRWLYFALLAALGVLFLFLAFLFLPMLVIAPQKFALLFTFGSFFLIAACAVLRGVWPFLLHLTERSRLPFSIAYVTSLILTLYGTLVAKSYILAIAFAACQAVCLFSFLASYVPGGVRALHYVKDFVVSLVKRTIQSFIGGGGESSLPL